MTSAASCSTPVHVALLNDHALVVDGLAAMLRPFRDRVRLSDVTVSAGDGDHVDIVLYDSFASDRESSHWSDFLQEGWAPRYVVLYDWDLPRPGPDPDGATTDGGPVALRVSKTLEGEALVEALEQIRATGSYEPAGTVPDEVAAAGRATERSWPGKAHGLTEREAEVVALIVEGLSNEEIAERLFLGINTIKTYIRTAYRTMGVTSRSTAVLWGIDHGLRRQRPSQ